jgi:hypothetical protein
MKGVDRIHDTKLAAAALEAVLADQEAHRTDRSPWACVDDMMADDDWNRRFSAHLPDELQGQDPQDAQERPAGAPGLPQDEQKPQAGIEEEPTKRKRRPRPPPRHPAGLGGGALSHAASPTLGRHAARLDRVLGVYPELRAEVAAVAGVQVSDLNRVLAGRSDFAATRWNLIWKFLSGRCTP